MRVSDVMTTEVTTVPADMPLESVAALLVERRISGVPVLDARERLVGVVSQHDLVRSVAGMTNGRRGPRRGSGPLTRDVMSRPAVTIPVQRSASAAAALMNAHKVSRLPVLDGKRLVGIVTRADLVRAFARGDDAIEQEIWSDVVLRGVHVNPRLLQIRIEGGEVTVSGEVETRGKAERLVEYLERVPGVVSVRSDVTWRLKDGAPKGVPPARKI
jgi:CBS domain-containing protein